MGKQVIQSVGAGSSSYTLPSNRKTADDLGYATTNEGGGVRD